MGPTPYLFLVAMIISTRGLNPNEEASNGTPKPTSDILQTNNQDDDNRESGYKSISAGVVDKLANLTPPYFTKPKNMPTFEVKPAGNMVNLKCKAGGNPTPNITWLKDQAVIQRRLGSIRYGPWSLIIEDLVTDDVGNYTCFVCNILGCKNHTIYVNVVERYHNRPILIKSPQNKTVPIGGSANFTCSLVSDLNPHITWVKSKVENYSIASQEPIIETSRHSKHPETLELHNVTYESEGWYTCVASNSLGQSHASAYLRVVDCKLPTGINCM